ncbi:choline/ethanolamine kinase family protein [Sporosarcina sp. HYO08]|uniref:choline/ethanolamine kinase family protein n=1 Tax=Sporosarcina sp. HYO08 TaxID=1759557 RepID=UPI000791EF18|nr:choline/ethanolamine kinase family protein [Sporosarcina sp. HYO08]KXH81867.1 hypothetical protein AU377_06280 [Sporosarcina sp. HYO08]
MELAKVIEIIRQSIQMPDASIEIIKRVGGMTNINYLITIDAREYIVRIPGKGTGALVNRQEEMENLQLATTLGINPQLFYFNDVSGFKITEKITGAVTLTPALAGLDSMMEKVAALFQKLHRAEVHMNNQFDLFALIETYERLVKEVNVPLFRHYEKVKEDLFKLKTLYESFTIQETPCHIDPSYTNFIQSTDGNLYLIDWEYSGQFDPLWDVAAFSLESGLSEREESIFHQHYFQRPLTKQEQQRIAMHKIFQDFLWSLWTLFKEAKGDEFGAYGMKRFLRAQENMKKFQQIFAI